MRFFSRLCRAVFARPSCRSLVTGTEQFEKVCFNPQVRGIKAKQQLENERELLDERVRDFIEQMHPAIRAQLVRRYNAGYDAGYKDGRKVGEE